MQSGVSEPLTGSDEHGHWSSGWRDQWRRDQWSDGCSARFVAQEWDRAWRDYQLQRLDDLFSQALPIVHWLLGDMWVQQRLQSQQQQQHHPQQQQQEEQQASPASLVAPVSATPPGGAGPVQGIELGGDARPSCTPPQSPRKTALPVADATPHAPVTPVVPISILESTLPSVQQQQQQEHQQQQPWEWYGPEEPKLWRWSARCQECGFTAISEWGIGASPQKPYRWNKALTRCPTCMRQPGSPLLPPPLVAQDSNAVAASGATHQGASTAATCMVQEGPPLPPPTPVAQSSNAVAASGATEHVASTAAPRQPTLHTVR